MSANDSQHLAWAVGKVLKVLSALCANSGEFRERLRWAVDELSVIPREGLPAHICHQLENIDVRMLEGYVPGPPPHHYTIVSENIRKIRGKKRTALAEDIILICMDICEAHGKATGQRLKGITP